MILNRLSIIIAAIFISLATAVGIFAVFPAVFQMASNADSLVLLDLARDILSGNTLSYWNLPRAPYFFPDTLIAIGAMATGWYGYWSIVGIAIVNLILLIGALTILLKQAHHLPSPSLPTVALLTSVSLFVMGFIFPEALSNLYWQIFASGAHFLTAVVISIVLYLANPKKGEGLSYPVLALICFLTFAEAISDSMSLLLLMAWWPVQVFVRRHYLRHSFRDLLAIPLMIVLGTFLSFLLPRQELVGSFFSIAQFTNNLQFFFSWNSSSVWNYGFTILLLLLTCLWPFLLKGSWPTQWRDWGDLITNPFVAPSIAIFLATPLFYQEVGSLRYLSFPGFVSLLTLPLMYLRVSHWLSNKPFKMKALWIGLAILCLFGLAYGAHSSRQSTAIKGVNTLDKVGLSSAIENLPAALSCLSQARQQYPLKDGIASYWAARPIRFASQFEVFLAQINPWRPRSGYFLWGNNGLDFIYSDQASTLPRQYNFIIASNHEIEYGLWTAIASKASDRIVCPENTIYYYSDSQTLWDYLFPVELPFNLKSPKSEAKAETRAPPKNLQFPANELFTQVGIRQDKAIIATGSPGFLVFGPYTPIAPGHYRITAYGTLTGPDQNLGMLDAIGNNGSQTYFKIPITESGTKNQVLAQTEFTVNAPVKDLEFRVIVFNQVKGQFIKYQLERLSP